MTCKFLYISILKNYSTEIFNSVVLYAPKLIAALALLIIGIYSIKFVNKLVQKVMQSRQLDPTLSKFLLDILNWVLRILLFVSVIAKLGIETSSFVAILGAAGLAAVEAAILAFSASFFFCAEQADTATARENNPTSFKVCKFLFI